jgi:hypothetical protein
MHLKGRPLAKVLLVICLGLSSCSPNSNSNTDPESESKFDFQVNECTQGEITDGSAWITGQLNAFASADAKGAYAFASEQFRSEVSLDDFAAIIAGQYSALLTLDSFEIGKCTPNESGFVFQVDIVDKEKQNFTMQYLLSLIDGQWGVDAATIAEKEADLEA